MLYLYAAASPRCTSNVATSPYADHNSLVPAGRFIIPSSSKQTKRLTNRHLVLTRGIVKISLVVTHIFAKAFQLLRHGKGMPEPSLRRLMSPLLLIQGLGIAATQVAAEPIQRVQ